jgi:hypothetical protein
MKNKITQLDIYRSIRKFWDRNPRTKVIKNKRDSRNNTKVRLIKNYDTD